MQLFLIIFEYNDYKCYLPRLFTYDHWNEDESKALCQRVIDKLQQDESIKNLSVYPQGVGTLEEMYNKFLSILNAPNPKIQYLRIEDRKFYDKKFDDIYNAEYYSNVKIDKVDFPIRVFKKKTGEDVDEVYLPVVILEENID